MKQFANVAAVFVCAILGLLLLPLAWLEFESGETGEGVKSAILGVISLSFCAILCFTWKRA